MGMGCTKSGTMKRLVFEPNVMEVRVDNDSQITFIYSFKVIKVSKPVTDGVRIWANWYYVTNNSVKIKFHDKKWAQNLFLNINTPIKSAECDIKLQSNCNINKQ